MYQYGKKRIVPKKPCFKLQSAYNYFIVILLIISSMFFLRVCFVLSRNNERGAFAYVEMLNIGMPLIENVEYDEGTYAENRVSLKYVLMEALYLNDINPENIIKNEMSIFNMYNNKIYTNENSDLYKYDSFVINEDSISKVKINESGVAKQIYDPSLKKPLDKSKPEILIYHTHTHENYGSDTDSTNESTNVVGAGDVLAKELEEKYGFAVIHDKTDHCISYNDSYTRSGETVDKYIQKYGDFKLIIDFHRDSLTNKEVTTTTICGVNAARVMFVNAKNSTRYEKNKEITEKIFNKTSELFPTLPRKILTYTRGKYAFNQSKCDNSVLFEVGSNCNTPQEAQVTAECMARVIAEVLN